MLTKVITMSASNASLNKNYTPLVNVSKLSATAAASIVGSCDPKPKRLLCTNSILDSFIGCKKKKNTEGIPLNTTESRSLKADLIGAKVNIVFLENKLKQLEQQHSKMQILCDTKVRKLEEHRWWDKIQIREVTSALTKVREHEAVVKEELVNLQNKFDVLRSSSDVNIERFENQLTHLKLKLSIEQSKKLDELENYKQTIAELQQVLKISREIETSQKSYMEDLERRLAEKNELARDLELKGFELYNARLELKALQYLKENYELYQRQINIHEKKLYGYGILEKENQRLKEDNKQLRELIKGKLLLEEQVYDLNNRLRRFKENNVELEELRVKQTQSDHYLDEWRAVANGLCESNVSDSRLPHVLKCAIESLQKQEITLTADKVSLESNLNATLHACDLATSDLDKTRKQFIETKKNCEESQNLIQHLQNKLTIVCAERDCYRTQLESYESDVLMHISARNDGNKEAQKIDKDLIKNLTMLNEKYRLMMAKLEDDLKKVKPTESNQTLGNQIILLQSEVGHLKSQNNYLQAQRDSLEVHLEKLAKIGLKPDCTEIEEYQALLKQVEYLKGQVSVRNSDIQCIKTQYEEKFENVKQQHQLSENQIKNLKEYCKTSLDELRNVVYILFGYKIDSENDNQYTLTSIFARDEEDEQLCFQLGCEGVMNLLENKYSLSLGNLIDVHLRQHKSIPMFLSAITTDLFKNQQIAATETVEMEDESSNSTTDISEGHSSKISVYDSSDKSSEYSPKHSDSPRSEISDSLEDSSDA